MSLLLRVHHECRKYALCLLVCCTCLVYHHVAVSLLWGLFFFSCLSIVSLSTVGQALRDFLFIVMFVSTSSTDVSVVPVVRSCRQYTTMSYLVVQDQQDLFISKIPSRISL